MFYFGEGREGEFVIEAIFESIHIFQNKKKITPKF